MEQIEQALPDQWRPLFRALTVLVAWIIPFQKFLLSWVWSADVAQLGFFKRLFLLLPATSVIVGLWCFMTGIYTLIFRSHRIRFVSTMMILWWDVARCTWLFWGGMGKFVFVAVGALWGALRLAVETVLELVREIIEFPFAITGSVTRTLRQPGVPWLAFVLTLMWSALEATIFSYILAPTVGEIVSDLTGVDTHRYLVVFLFLMLFFLIAGSLACMHVLLDAVKRKDVPQIVQMAIVEFFVMFVEVVFFYRELVDSLTPWIAQQTGLQMGLVPVILFASFGWLGVRGMVWFLFARFGTPTVLAIIARERLPEEAAAETSPAAPERRWDMVVGKLKRDQAWFEDKAQTLLEAAILPCFQLIAAALNFPIALFSSEPLFSLPFKSLEDVHETRLLIERVMGRAVQGQIQ